MARPTKMTAATIKKLEEAFSNSFTDMEACIYVGITTQTLYTYCKKNKAFLDYKELLKKKPALRAKINIVESLTSGDINDSKWWLERKSRDEFSLRNEHTGADGTPLMDIAKDKEFLRSMGLLEDNESEKD